MRLSGQYDPEKLANIVKMKMPVFFLRLSMTKCRDLEGQLNAIAQNFDDYAEIEPTPIPDIPPGILETLRQQIQEDFARKVIQDVMAQGQAEMQQTGVPLTEDEIATKYMPSPEELTHQYSQHEDEQVEMLKKEAQKVASERASNMQKKMNDQLIEAGFEDVMRAIRKDIGEYPGCIVKGPIFRREKVLSYVSDEVTGTWTPKVENKLVFKLSRINPQDWYPQADVKRFGEGNNIEIERMSRGELARLIGTPGYKDDKIKQVLTDYPQGYMINQDIDQQRLILDNKTQSVSPGESRDYQILNLWGEVAGDILLDYGMDSKDVPDPIQSYAINAKVIGSHVIKAVLNPDPLGRQPYQGTAFRKNNDSPWGESVPEINAELEDAANAALRPLLKNMSMAAVPITEVNVRKLDTESGETGDLWAGKVFRIYDVDQNGQPAVRVYNVDMNAPQLMAIFEKFKREMDDMIIPAFGHGNEQVGGAGNTASGLSMLRTDSARNVQLCFENIYNDIIVPVIEKLFTYNMMYVDDPNIKGDLRIKAKSIATIMAKEQLSMRRAELLPVTNNPVDMGIMGRSGRQEQLAQAFKAVEMDVDKLLPNKEAIEQEGRAAEMNTGQQMLPPGQGDTNPPSASQQLDAAGRPVAGQDTALFQEGK